LPGHKTEPPYLISGGGGEGRDFDDRFACFGDDERFAVGGLFDEFGEMRFRLVNIHCFHFIDRP